MLARWSNGKVSNFGFKGPGFKSGSTPIFFSHINFITFFQTNLLDYLRKWQTPFWNWHCLSVFHNLSKWQKCEKKWKKKCSLQDSNPDLPIQSQLCLPLDQGFMKIAWKYEKFLTRFFKIQIWNVFSYWIITNTFSKIPEGSETNCHQVFSH